METSKYTYDYTYDNPLILSEGYNNNSYKSNYVYVDNRLLEDTKSNKSYLYDGKYSISEVLSSNSTLSLRYDIYGNITNTKLSQEDKTFSYNTLEYTPQNRLYYIKARYYDPTISSFITKDTYLGNIYKPITTNRYAYCSGDPVNYIDINGHAGWSVSDIQRALMKSKEKKKEPTTSNNQSIGPYISSSGGGSNHRYYPPPPDPRQYYVSLVTGPYSVSNSYNDYIYKELNTKKTIKQLITNNSYSIGNYSMLYASSYNIPSKSEQQMLLNNLSKTKTTSSIGEVDKNKVNNVQNNKIASLLEITKREPVFPIQELLNKEKDNTPTNEATSCGAFDFSDFEIDIEYKMGTPQFESTWSTVESIRGNKLARPTGGSPDNHDYQCVTLVNALFESINQLDRVSGNGKEKASNIYNAYPNQFELLSTADGTLNPNSIINEGAVISFYYTDSAAKSLADYCNNAMSQKEFLEYGHVLINTANNGNKLTLIEGNVDSHGSVKKTQVELEQLINNPDYYLKIEIANPIK